MFDDESQFSLSDESLMELLFHRSSARPTQQDCEIISTLDLSSGHQR